MCDTKDADSKVNRKRRRCCNDPLGKVVALVSVLILAATFFFSVIQYRKQQTESVERQKLDQLIRIQSQIRNDTDAISQFPRNKNMAISGAEFLLADIDGLLRSECEVDTNKCQSAEQDRQRISKILYDLVNEDCDFAEHRNVSLSIAVFEYWDDYKEYVKGDDLVWDLLAVKYNEAIEALRKRNKFISTLKYNKDDASFEPTVPITTAEDPDFRHFEDLVRGYYKHLSLLDADWGQKKKLLIRFQAASCNKQLTDDRFGWSANPEDYPDWFAECP